MSKSIVRKELDALTLAGQVDQMLSLGQTLVKSGLLPNGVKSPEAAVTIILKGRELGIPPMTALSHIHVISGKPTLSAELMLSLALQAGLEVWVAETNAQRATVKGVRNGREQSLTFTMQEAKQAGVTNNATWTKYPAAMLRARAISAFMRVFAPDVLNGASYTPEEMGAEIDEDGEVVDATFAVETQEASQDALASPTTPDEVVPPPVASQEAPEDSDAITPQQIKALSIALKTAGIGTSDEEKAQGREFVAWLAGAGELQSIKDLSKSGASKAMQRIGNDWADEETGEISYRVDKKKLEAEFQAWADYKASQEFDADNPITENDAAPWEAFA